MYIGSLRKLTNAAAVASAGTVYTNSFPLGYSSYFGLWLLATSSGGTPDIKVDLQQGIAPPATEGPSDTNWVIPDGLGSVSGGINDQLVHIFSLSPKPLPYARFKLTGQGSNPADALMTMYIFLQEQA